MKKQSIGPYKVLQRQVGDFEAYLQGKGNVEIHEVEQPTPQPQASSPLPKPPPPSRTPKMTLNTKEWLDRLRQQRKESEASRKAEKERRIAARVTAREVEKEAERQAAEKEAEWEERVKMTTKPNV